ncbi:hypothetical protein BV20DRAFT_858563 [Pilatotrama ljubarskyi]|nr:hypothetical protein BV20DRAFT_858563 [Pilatotrama ljubarskyi]
MPPLGRTLGQEEVVIPLEPVHHWHERRPVASFSSRETFDQTDGESLVSQERCSLTLAVWLPLSAASGWVLCVAPSVLFPNLGIWIIRSDMASHRAFLDGPLLPAAMLGSLVVGSPVGLAWYGLYRYLSQGWNDSRVVRRWRLRLLSVIYVVQCSIFGFVSFVTGTALVQMYDSLPGGMTLGNASLLFVYGGVVLVPAWCVVIAVAYVVIAP